MICAGPAEQGWVSRCCACCGGCWWCRASHAGMHCPLPTNGARKLVFVTSKRALHERWHLQAQQG